MINIITINNDDVFTPLNILCFLCIHSHKDTLNQAKCKIIVWLCYLYILCVTNKKSPTAKSTNKKGIHIDILIKWAEHNVTYNNINRIISVIILRAFTIPWFNFHPIKLKEIIFLHNKNLLTNTRKWHKRIINCKIKYKITN